MGKGNPSQNCKQTSQAREGRSSSTCPASRSGKACKSGGGKKTPQERGKAHFPREL
jgi:hypothetical protein